MNAPWRIELFGGLQLFGDNGVVLSRFQTRKTGALLGYLAYYKDKPVSREVLADLFWPENDPEAARNSLRVALNSLRRQLEPPGIPPGGVLSADRATVRLNPHAVITDTAEWERALKAERNADTDSAKITHLTDAVECYKGPLLSGWYEEWIDLEQTRLAEVCAGVLRRLTSLLFKTRDFDRALEFAQRAVASDPLREENHCHLMRLYAALGRPDAALKAFRDLESILRDEMNAPPSGVTRDLVKQIAALPAAPAPQLLGGGGSIGEGLEPVSFAAVPESSPADTVPVQPFSNPAVAAAAADTVGSVPLQWTRFWGREKELARLSALLLPSLGENQSAQMVTITGPGGVGKTRLAIESASRLRQNGYNGRVWFVPLHELHSEGGDEPAASDGVADASQQEERILLAVAHVLRLSPTGNAPNDAFERIAATLVREAAPTLLVLDDVPQTDAGLGSAARIIGRLRQIVPGLSCLATSRQRLDLSSEREVILEPLPLPFLPPSVGQSDISTVAPAHLLESLSACPSVALFVERAQIVRPDFQITPRNAYAIADLCQRLDGLPLALELAAAWSRLLTPAQMVERTQENAFALLSTERRDLPPRHRSLECVLRNDCRHLSPPLRAFLAALSVFEGGWTLGAAQVLCASEPHAAGNTGCDDVLSLLDALQARSLLYAHETDHGLRFRLLQTTRRFAQKLLSPTACARLTTAHAAYYAKLAQTAQPFLGGSAAETWRVLLDDEQENFRVLLHAACEASAPVPVVERGLQTAAALWRYWYVRGQSDEGAYFLEALLQHPHFTENKSPYLRACALHGAGRLALSRGQATQAGLRFGECLDLLSSLPWQEVPDQTPFLLTKTLVGKDLAIAARARGDFDMARNAHAQVLHEKRKSGDAWGTASALSEWGSDALLRGDAQDAHAAFVQSARLRRALGDQWGAAEAEAGVAQALAAGDDTAGDDAAGRADALRQQVAQEMDAMGDVQGIATSFLNLGYVAAEQDDWEAALPLLRDAVSLFQTQKNHEAAALAWWLIAVSAERQNELPLAVSAAETALTESQVGTWSFSALDAPSPSAANDDGETRIPLLAAHLLTQMESKRQGKER